MRNNCQAITKVCGALLVLVSGMLLMGHYRGYRLSELRRFRVLARDAENR